MKKSYKVWMIIEEYIEHDDGTEEFRDMKEAETRSAGCFSTLEEAENQMNEIAMQYSGDFTN